MFRKLKYENIMNSCVETNANERLFPYSNPIHSWVDKYPSNKYISCTYLGVY